MSKIKKYKMWVLNLSQILVNLVNGFLKKHVWKLKKNHLIFTIYKQSFTDFYMNCDFMANFLNNILSIILADLSCI